MEIRLATERELDSWMKLVSEVKDAFPGLDTQEAMEEYKTTVREFMERQSAICAVQDSHVVGALLFSKEQCKLCFLVVDPAHRRQHIAEGMVAYMLTLIEPGKNLTVTTYRDGKPEGVAARAFYRRMGFAEGKLAEEFGSPVQEFVLER